MGTIDGRRPKMNREERAKQFAPFAALKGYEEALERVENSVEQIVSLTEEECEILEHNIHIVKAGDMVNVVYTKNGKMFCIQGLVSRIDYDAEILKIVSTSIRFANIRGLNILKQRADYIEIWDT